MTMTLTHVEPINSVYLYLHGILYMLGYVGTRCEVYVDDSDPDPCGTN